MDRQTHTDLAGATGSGEQSNPQKRKPNEDPDGIPDRTKKINTGDLVSSSDSNGSHDGPSSATTSALSKPSAMLEIRGLTDVTLLYSALGVLYRTMKVCPTQIKQLQCSEAQHTLQLLDETVAAVSLMRQHVFSLIAHAKDASEKLPVSFFLVLQATYQDSELETMGFVGGSWGIMTEWATATPEARIALKLKLVHWLMDLSRYTIMAMCIVCSLLLRQYGLQQYPDRNPFDDSTFLGNISRHAALDETARKINIPMERTSCFQLPDEALEVDDLGKAVLEYNRLKEKADKFTWERIFDFIKGYE